MFMNLGLTSQKQSETKVLYYTLLESRTSDLERVGGFPGQDEGKPPAAQPPRSPAELSKSCVALRKSLTFSEAHLTI